MNLDSGPELDMEQKRQALFEALLAQEKIADAASTKISRSGSNVGPLSFAQERMWFLAQLNPGSAFYNMPFVLRLRGTLDVAILERSLEELVRRHEPLRTRIRKVDGRPAQVVEACEPLATSFADLSMLPEHARASESKRVCEAIATRPFDLERD